MYLQCVEETDAERRIVSFPAAITDYFSVPSGQIGIDSKSYFTIEGLTDVAYILDHGVGLSV